MEVWVFASILYISLLLSKAEEDRLGTIVVEEVTTASPRGANSNSNSSKVHRAVTTSNLEVSASKLLNYEIPYIPMYQYSIEDAVPNYNNPITTHNIEYGYNFADGQEQQEFSSLEIQNDPDLHDTKDYLDTSGFKHYKTSTSLNVESPSQIETISTNSYHKKVEPYDVSNFQQQPNREENDEVHYHEHKHLHKHKHAQEHLHKHKQEHKHQHGHGHEHNGYHKHSDESRHQHFHQSDHQHGHKAQHSHKHHEGHEHDHQEWHQHGHGHHQEHEHAQRHDHQHEHSDGHKHDHRNGHKHEHYHGHKHDGDHKHKHKHGGYHTHDHSRKEEHKHRHKDYHSHHYSHKH